MVSGDSPPAERFTTSITLLVGQTEFYLDRFLRRVHHLNTCVTELCEEVIEIVALHYGLIDNTFELRRTVSADDSRS